MQHWSETHVQQRLSDSYVRRAPRQNDSFASQPMRSGLCRPHCGREATISGAHAAASRLWGMFELFFPSPFSPISFFSSQHPFALYLFCTSNLQRVPAKITVNVAAVPCGGARARLGGSHA